MEKTESHLTKLKQMAASVKADDLMSEITELQEKLEKERLYIVVLGLFKRGKSSLINALLGKDLLPVAVTPLTAVITILEYTTGESFAEVEFMDGSRDKKKVEEIPQYVSEEENPDNIKKVNVVRIYNRCDILKCVSLVDTPGLGSAFEHNSTTTLRFIPKIDAAIFVLSADIPVSQQDIEFVNELKETVPRILYVMTKTDLLGPTDLEKMITHNSYIISRLSGKAISPGEWHLVSSRNNRASSPESGIPALRRVIESIGQNEKDELLKLATDKQYGLLHNRLQLLMQFKMDALNIPLNELEQKQATMKRSMEIMQGQRDEFESIINGKIRVLQEQIHTIVSNEARLIKETVYQKLNEFSDHLQDIQKRREVQLYLNEFILGHFNAVKIQLEDKTREQFIHLLEQYSTRSHGFLSEFAAHLHSLMGISFDIIAGQFDLNIYTSFYLTLDSGSDVFIVKKSVFDILVPEKIHIRSILRHLRDHYHSIIIRNSSSIGYDLEYKVQESFRKFSYDLNRRLSELMKNIEGILSTTVDLRNKHSFLISDEMEDLKNKLLILNDLKLYK